LVSTGGILIIRSLSRSGRKVLLSILLVYVDDIVLTDDDTESIRELKKYNGKVFDIKDLGPLKYFLGIEVARSQKGIFISQRKYTLDLLEETGKLGVKPIYSPMELHHHLSPDDGELLEDPGHYQRLVGKLNYLTIPRPDLSYAVGVVSQFMHAPRRSHLEAVHRILRKSHHLDEGGILYASYA
jgi:hypothetical protein